ncbi:MAG: hypothetical protein AAGJ18_25245 [Bacteroidota bacterium]
MNNPFLIVLFSAFIAPSLSYGQSTIQKATWDIQAGLLVNDLQIQENVLRFAESNTVATTAEVTADYRGKTGFYTGLLFQKPINETWQWSSGLLLRYQVSDKQFVYTFRDKAIPEDVLAIRTENTEMTTLNLNLPLMLQTHKNFGRLKVIIGGGGYYNLKLYGREMVNATTNSFYETQTDFSPDCDCATIIAKTPINTAFSRSYELKSFSVQHVGVLGNLSFQWPLRTENRIGLTYTFTHDLQSFYEDDQSLGEFIASNGNRYRTHQIGLTYQLPNQLPETFESKPLAKNWLLGAGVAAFGLYNGFGYGPVLNVGRFFSDRSGVEVLFSLVDNPLTDDPIFNDGFQRIGIDLNYLHQLSSVFYAKAGVSFLFAPFTNPDLGEQGGTAVQIGAGALWPITPKLHLKMDVQPKVWVTEVEENRVVLSGQLGFVTLL